MELIVIKTAQIGNEEINTVNARELHAFLGIGKDFSSWMKDQIKRARLVEGRDYLLTQKGEQLPSGMKYLSQYHLTIESAKHIGMMSGSDKGFEVRDYFIECERQAKQSNVDPMQALNDPATMRGLLLTYSEKVLHLETKVTERDKLISDIQPQAAALRRISLADGSLCITDAAKTLNIRPKQLFDYLSAKKWIYRRLGTGWIAYQDKLQQQLLEHKISTIERNDGSDKVTEQVRVTPKGISRLAVECEQFTIIENNIK